MYLSSNLLSSSLLDPNIQLSYLVIKHPLLTETVIDRPNDGSSKVLRNMGHYLPDFSAEHNSRRENLKTRLYFVFSP
jgi:hypothetical protein